LIGKVLVGMGLIPAAFKKELDVGFVPKAGIHIHIKTSTQS